MSGEFRQYLFPHDHPRLAEVRGLDAYAYRDVARTPGTFTGGLVEGWTPLYRNEFRGVTEDGTLREGLYPFEPARPGEEAPVAAMVAAAHDLLAALDDDGRDADLPSPSTPSSGRPGPTRSSCSSTPACGWSSSRPRCGRRRWRWCGPR